MSSNLYIKTMLVVFVSLTCFLTACSEVKTPDQYITSAKHYLEQSEHNAAIVELKNAIRITPKNPELRYLLGLVYIQLGDMHYAEKELEKAKDYGFPSAKVFPKLALVKLELGHTDDVYDLALQAKDQSDDVYVAILTYAGLAAIKAGDKEKSENYINEALSISEGGIYSQLGKAWLESSENKVENALETVESVLLKDPDFSAALLLKGHLNHYMKNFDLAIEQFSKYLTQHPQAHEKRFFLVMSYIENKQFDKAQEQVDLLLIINPSQPLTNQLKAQILYTRNNFKGAKEFAVNAIQNSEQLLATSQLIAGVSAFKLKEFELAYKYILPIENVLPLNHPVKKLSVIVKMHLGYVEEAADDLVQLEGLSELELGLLQETSMDLLRAGKIDKAKQVINKAQDIAPDSAKVATQKGMLLLFQDNLSGIDELEKAISLDPEFSDPKYVLAYNYLESNQFNKALNVAKDWQELDSGKVPGTVLEGLVYAKQGLNKKAIAKYEQALVLEPKNISALYNLALQQQKYEQKEQAILNYQRLLSVQPDHRRALTNLSEIHVFLNTIEDNVVFLEGLARESSNNITVMLTLVQNLRAVKQFDKAINFLEKITPKNPSDLPLGYWLALGDTYAQAMKKEKATIIYEQLNKDHPNIIQITFRHLGMLEINKRYSKGIDVVRAALKTTPGDNRLMMLEAHFELLNGNVDTASQLLTGLNRKNISYPLLDNIDAKIALIRKNYPQAIASYKALYEKRPLGKNAINLAMSFKLNGQHDDAEKLLELHLTQYKNEPAVRTLLGQYYSKHAPEKTIVHYRELLKQYPDNFVILNNLAWVELSVGDISNALIHIELVYNKLPENSQVLSTYGAILLKSDNLAKALAILKEAVDRGAKDPETHLYLAEAHILSGDKNKGYTVLDN